MDGIKHFFRNHKLSIAILFFIFIFTGIHTVKPGFIYTEEGGFRPFGVGYRDKTVVPIWLASIAIAILSYWAVLWLTVYL
jgi:hypothetical protein